jgi:hypothetical protein
VFERPIVIGQRLRWRYADSNKPSEDAVIVNVRTDLEEGLSPEATDYAALWIEAKYVQDPPEARPFTIELATDKLIYIEGKEVTIDLLES